MLLLVAATRMSELRCMKANLMPAACMEVMASWPIWTKLHGKHKILDLRAVALNGAGDLRAYRCGQWEDAY